MKLNIPFEKEIEFDSNINEICSISLEHEITKNATDLLGSFIFTGTYKEDPLSVNETPFNFVVPFSVDFTSPVNTDSIDFSIDNFTYDILDNKLIVKIDFCVSADLEETRKDEEHIYEERDQKDTDEVNKEEVIINKPILEDDFITYHVHEIKEDETIDLICNKYNIDSTMLYKINPNIEINKGNRLIIPLDNE